MNRTLLMLLAPALLAAASDFHEGIRFRKHEIHPGAAETCAVADINGDGRLDIVSGENWFEAPAWKAHRFRRLGYERFYVDDFSDLILDVNGDGRPDVISATWFAREIAWWENPGAAGGEWPKHVIQKGFPTEFAFLVDLDNDGKPLELVPQFGPKKAPLVWFEIEGGKFVRRAVSERSYGHGIGAGDVNGDGRTDILTPAGWWEAPEDPAGEGWVHHEDFAQFEFPHLGFLYVRDINEDGRPDVVTSFAHGYGLLWLERTPEGGWKKHVIDESWSQAHAVTLADLDGDGREDVVTGKRFHAHNGKDPGGREPLGLYWYERRVQAGGKVVWKRHVIDYGSRAGGGMQIAVTDIDGDGDRDVIAGGKGGLFWFENLTAGR